MVKREAQEVFPLSPMQRGIMFHCLNEPGSGVYVENHRYVLDGLETGSFRRAWELVVECYPVFRTSVVGTGREKPAQVVWSRVDLPWRDHDARGLSVQEQEAWITTYMEEDRSRGFGLDEPSLTRFMLVRCGETRYQFIWTTHHIVLDGWSAPNVYHAALETYEALRRGELPNLVPPRPYSDFIAWLHEQDAGAAEAYWRDRLAGLSGPTRVAGGEVRPVITRYAAAENHLSADLTRLLGEAAARSRVTLNTLIQGAWALLLSRYSGEDDVIFGTVVSGRPEALDGVELMVGMFINTVPFRIEVPASGRIDQWLRSVQTLQLEQRQHEWSPLWEVQRWSGLPASTPLLEVLYVFQNQAVRLRASGADSKSARVKPSVIRSGYPLMLVVVPGRGISVKLEYDADRYDRVMIERMLRHLCRVLETLARLPGVASGEPGVSLSRLAFWTAAERHQALIEDSDTARRLPAEVQVHRRIARQAGRTPDRVALVGGEDHLTYGALRGRAGELGGRLRRGGAGPGALVGLCVERGPEMVAALLAVLEAGAAYVPLDPGLPAQRLAYMAKDAGLAGLVCERSLAARVPAVAALAEAVAGAVLWLDAGGVAAVGAKPGPDAGLDAEPDELAYVIYTSGSTGRPKGVQLSHRNVVNFLRAMAREPGLDASDTVLAVTTLSFDIAVLEVLLPLMVGAKTVIATSAVAADGERLARLASRARASLMQATPATWQLLVQLGWPGQPGLRILCGGEALPRRLAAELVGRGRELWNLYGPTETTVWSAASRIRPGEADVTLGRPIDNTGLLVLDRRLRPVPRGILGQLAISGAGLARGYFRRPALTAGSFCPDPNACGGERLYLTGDLVHRDGAGRLFYLGRLDHQVKLRGFRIELGEIEAALEALPAVERAVVLLHEAGGDHRLMAFLRTVEAGMPAETQIRTHLASRLPEYMIPAAFLAVAEVPLTPSGKVDRKALGRRASELLAAAGPAAAEPPRGPVEEAVAAAFAGVLQREQVGRHESFFRLGGHSLLAIEVIFRLRVVLEIELPLRAVFEAPTAAGLAARLETARGAPAGVEVPPVVAGPRPEPLPLSFGQERLWFLEQLEPGSPAYHLVSAVWIEGTFDAGALGRSLRRLAQRHESLRTTFVATGGVPRQVVAADAGIELEAERRPSLGPEEEDRCARELIREQAERPFDFVRGPMMQARLVAFGGRRHLFVLCLHHIVTDGWSQGVLARELSALYAACRRGPDASPPLPELPVQYGDFAVWQRRWLEGDVLRRQLGFWKQRLRGVPALELPVDRPRPVDRSQPASPGGAAGVERLRLSAELVDALTAIGGGSTTPFMALLAAFSGLLYRLTGQVDFAVGSPVANRRRPELEGLIGLFINLLALRVDLAGDPSYRQLLARVREAALGAFSHPDLPFEKLVDELSLERLSGRSPLFQVLFALQNVESGSFAFPDAEVRPVTQAVATTRFDLELYAWQSGAGSASRRLRRSSSEDAGAWELALVYNAGLFAATTVRRLARYLERLSEAALAEPDAPLSRLALSTAAERHQARFEDPCRALLASARRGAPAADRPADSPSRGTAPEPVAASEPPRGPTEGVVARAFREVLRRTRVGRGESFFHLGGHSLLATRLLSRLREALDVELPLRAIFDSPTVAGLAAAIGAAEALPPAAPIRHLVPGSRGGEPQLSFGQQRLWVVEHLAPDGFAYHVPATVRLAGSLDVPVLGRALAEIARRHETLRSRFPSAGGKPRVEIVAPGGPELRVEDLEPLAREERFAEAIRRARHEATRPFDLARGPLWRVKLFRLAAEDHVLHFTLHHIVSDGWSMGILFKELDALYRAFGEGRPSPLPEPAIQYADFARWQRRYLEGPSLAGDLAYWRRQLADGPAGRAPVLDLPADRPRPIASSHRGDTVEVPVPSGLLPGLTRLARSSGATLFMALLATFQVLLARLSGQHDVVAGTPIAGRGQRQVEELIGFFVNNLVLRGDLSGDPSFRRLLDRVRRMVLDAFAHSEAPFEKLVEDLQPERDLSRNPLFQVEFNHVTLDSADRRRLGDLGLEGVGRPLEISKFDLTLHTYEESGRLHVRFEYSTDLFDAPSVERFGGQYLRLLAAIAEDPEQAISRLPLLSAGERRQVLVEWSGGSEPPAAAPTVVELFEHHAARSPGNLALVFEGRELSYRELDLESARLARRLQARGVGPEVKVALCLERSWQMIVALLGVLRAGGAYLPLDPGHPPDRLAFLIDDSEARVVVSESSLGGHLPPEHRRKVVAIDRGEMDEPGQAPLPAAGDGQLAYLIYTSGSTGQPKGVEITHGQLAAYVAGVLRRLALPAKASFATVSTLAADLGNTVIFGAMATGGALHVISEERIGDADAFAEIMRRRQIDCVKIVPSHLEALLAAAARPREILPRKLLVLGGEASGWQLIRRVEILAPECTVLNHYGPTETSVGVSTHRLAAGDRERFPAGPPIGRPLAATTAYLLDRHGEPVPPAAVGELFLGGRQVARGYLGRPRLTAERFVPDPFAEGEGARLYRTGDLARWAGGGELAFLGRADDQVKIRGFRVELAEIEAAIDRHPAVRASAVLVHRAEDGARRLVAYLVSSDGQAPAELRAFLKRRLPDYMVPSSFVALEALPLTPNGKLDRRALPAPEESRLSAGAEYKAPRTPAEETLAGIWSRVLRIERVGVHDNYFDLGGESILSIQIVSRANREGLRLTPRDLFLHPTVAELAAVAGSAPVPVTEQGEVAGPVALTPIQHRFFELPLADPHHYNHARLLELRRPVDGEALRRAVARVVAHHDVLRARYRRRGGEWQQRIADVLPGPVPSARLDLSRLADAGPAIEFLAARLQASLDLAEGPILRVAHFELGTGRADRLLIVIHHLAVDAVSWQILIEDLAGACQVAGGEAPELPPKTTSYREWSRRLADHASSEALDAQLAFWRRPATPAAPRLPVDHPGGEEANTGATADMVPASLTRDETEALLRAVPRAYRTGIDDVLLTALARAMAEWTGSSAVLLDLEGHGREDLFEGVDLSRSVGWFTAVYPVVLDLAEGQGPGPGEALKAVKEQLRRIPDRGLGWGLARYLRREPALAELPPAEISFNYLGRLDREVQDSPLFARAGESAGLLSGPHNRRRYLLDVLGSVTSGELRMRFIYTRAVHERGTVERLATGFLSALRELIAHCTAPGAGGFTPSDFPLARLDQGTLDRLEERYREPGIEDVYRLSPLQEGLVYHTLAAPDSEVYVTQMSCVLAPGETGPVAPAAWRRAWQRAVDRQPVLRTAFLAGEVDEMHQVVCRHLPVPWRELDWRRLPAGEQRRQAAELRRSERRGFDLQRPPLLRLVLARLDEDRYQFVWTHHHALLDGWSLPLLVREVFEHYAGARIGRQQQAEPARPFSRYVGWLARQDRAAAETYWRRVLAAMDEPAPLPGARTGRGAPEASEVGSLHLSAAESSRLAATAREHRLTLNTVVLGAWAILLSRLGGRRQVTLGVTVAGRPAGLPGAEEMVGSFINTLPLAIEVGSGPVVECLRRLQDQQSEMLVYEHFALYEIQALAGRAGRPLFDCLFVFENYPPGALPGAGAPLAVLEPQHVSRANYPLTLVVQPGRRLRVELRYDPKLFDGAAISGLAGGLHALLAALGSDLDRRIPDLPLIAGACRRQLTADWNVPSPPLPVDCLHHRFERCAAERPGAVAVVCGDQQLSYGALDRRADRLARRLRALGVRPGTDTLVGLSLERGPELIVAMLGILKAGAAYLPLDLANPAERIAFILEDTRVPVLITTTSQLSRLPRTSARVLCLDAEGRAPAAGIGDPPPAAVRPEDPAYVIYTSGSTGKPKGVVIEHRSAMRLFTATETWFDFDQDDVWTLFHSAAFDFSVWEIWGALLYGGRLVVVPYPTSRSPEDFHSLLIDQRVSVLNQTPSAFRPLIRAADAAPAAGGLALDWVIFGGEALDPQSLAPWLERQGDDRPRLINMYGITETTVHVTYRRIRAADLEDVPGSMIGRPIPDLRLCALDRCCQRVPTGAPGELFVSGPGVARGYLARPRLTAGRFLPDPFSRRPGERLYRTGDLGRFLPDGDLEYLGRNDAQVQLRGFRVELGEIEAALSWHPGVAECVVLLRAAEQESLLVAYVVGESPAAAELRAFLKERLPEYMVPSAFVVLDAIPLTANGKVDRTALARAARPAGERQAGGAYVAPRTQLEDQIAAIWRQVLEIDEVGARDNFFDLGGHSLRLLRVQARLKEELGRGVSIAELFEHPTVETLVRHLAGDAEPAPPVTASARHRARRRHGEDSSVAVIGMAGRFPGAAGIEAFWENLENGVESIRFFTDDELRQAGVPEAELSHPDYVKARAILDGVDLWDARFFGYSPREAELIDPQQRLFLECASDALERAGYDPDRYGGMIGVYAGVSMNGYLMNLLSRPDVMAAAGGMETLLAADKDFLATRVSYKLGLRGPSLTVQTACSTSLVAVHQACRSLVDGQCDLAMAGGVSIPVPVLSGYRYVEQGIRSPDGHCRPFDARAQGTVSGSGVAIVVLKRLDEALADGDRIRAVIRGTAINNDGSQKVGFTAPSVEGQARAIALAQATAGVEPESIGYVETHGTGTALGDPIEIAALEKAFGEGTARRGHCALGSLKSNIGHLNDAAGVAGLIKTVLALEHRRIPPSLHFEEPNPEIDFDHGPFFVNAECRPWEALEKGPRRAGVSSFGLGGTNAHAVLEEAPPVAPSAASRRWQLLVLSARSGAALEAMTANLAADLGRRGDVELADVAYTLQVGRRQFEHRRAVIGRDVAGAVAALESGGPGARGTRRSPSAPGRAVFLFPGQGAQYAGMGHGLYQSEPVFRATVDRCCELLSGDLETDLRQVLYRAAGTPEETSARLQLTSWAQPALFVVEYALAEQWRAWGIEPSACIGHSIGEFVAACVSGVLELEDALRLVALRGRLMAGMPAGVMTAVPLAAAEVEARLAGETGLWLSAVNGPSLCAVSGTEARVAAWEAQRDAEGVACRRLHTSHAFHSGLMENAVAPFVDAVSAVAIGEPRIPYVSNVTGGWITAADVRDPGYWGRHIRQPVLISEGLDLILAEDRHVMLEVGPGEVLGTLARQQPRWNPERLAVASLRRPKDETPDQAFLLGALGRLWTGGVSIAWDQVHAGERRRRVELPTYPFERQRFWVERRQTPASPAPRSLARLPSIADWFSVPLWRQAAPLPAPYVAPEGAQRTNAPEGGQRNLSDAGRWLLFGADTPQGESALEALRSCGAEVEIATPKGLFEDLPARIVLCGGATDSARAALLDLARTLDALAGGEEREVVVVCSGLHAVTDEETRDPGAAALDAMARVMAQELPHLRCRTVDLGAGVPPRALAAELLATDGPPTVALRASRRWLLGYEPVALAGTSAEPVARDGKVYLITGGLGRIGLELGESLARDASATLVLSSRTPLAEDDGDARSRRLRAIEALGATVDVLPADVGDPAQAAALIREIDARYGRLDGVIHAAGVTRGSSRRAVATLDAAACEAQLGPKLRGLAALDQALRGRALDFRVATSSLSTIVGGLELGAYAAANAAMEAAAGASPDGWRTIALDGWAFDRQAEAKAARPDALRLTMTPEEGVEATRRAITADASLGHLVVSTADVAARIERWVTARPAAGPAAARLEAAEPPPPEVERHARPELASDYAAPRTAVERTLVEAWQTLFGIDRIGIHDDFYDLGGHSLLALQLLNRLNRAYGHASLSLRAVFEHPTIAQLAGLIEPDGDEEPEAEPDVSLRQRLLAATPSERRRLIGEHLRQEIARELGREVPEGFEDADPEALVGGLAWILKRDLRLPVYVHELRGRLAPEPLAEFVASELERMEELARGGGSSADPVAIERPARPGRGRPWSETGAKNRRAVFVLCAPRSGSTLLRLMLGGNPALFCPPELSLLGHDGMAGWLEVMHSHYTRDLVVRAFMAFMNLDDPAEGQALLEELAARDAPIFEVYRRIQERAGERTLVDKTPGYAMRPEVLERAEELFEDARYLHLVRHPYAVIESFVRQRMDRARGETGDPHALAERTWSLSNGNIEELCGGLDRRRLRVRYERLVREPAEVMAEVCDFLDLAFDPAMLRPYDSGRIFTGLGDPDILTHREIDARLADAWKKIRLPRRLSPYTRELAAELGYELPHEAREPETGEAGAPEAPAEIESVDVGELSDEQVNELLGELLAQREGEP